MNEGRASDSQSGTFPLRVLVVDDSAYNRQTITAMLEANPGVQVVGRAVDGKEALQLAFQLSPDLITLDLEMPEMDGFAFLRLLMKQRPIPVLIISGYSARENVFRALDLGALDFIAKPGKAISRDIKSIEAELRRKISMVRRLHGVRLAARAQSVAKQRRVTGTFRRAEDPTPAQAEIDGRPARVVVAVGSSTGGPPTVQQLLRALPGNLPAAILIAQHMPPRFTRAFAHRLNRVVDLRVVEAEAGQPIVDGTVYVIPGGNNFRLHCPADGPARVQLAPVVAGTGVVLAPTADELFAQLASHYGRAACGVILTGMGSDGVDGARVLADSGGRIYAEDPSTAIMPGMPQSVIEAGLADAVAPVEALHHEVADFVFAMEAVLDGTAPSR
jgi:two-component system chemotaxis response regulator CheB